MIYSQVEFPKAFRIGEGQPYRSLWIMIFIGLSNPSIGNII